MTLDKSASTAIGIALAVLGSCVNALGMNLQRLATTRANKTLNVIGIAMATSTGIFELASFNFAPQSLLAPFGAVTLVANLLLAPILHSDSVRAVDLFATAFVCLGVAICLSNSVATSESRTYDELVGLATRRAFCLWLGALGTVGLGCLAVLRRLGISHPLGAVLGPVLSGANGSCTVLVAKLIGEFFGAGAPKMGAALGVGAGVSAICQTYTLNRSVGAHSSLVVTPVFVATMVACNALGGGIFFKEFEALDPPQLAAYVAGLGSIVCGVASIAAAHLIARPKVE